jgi:hypothetical protein
MLGTPAELSDKLQGIYTTTITMGTSEEVPMWKFPITVRLIDCNFISLIITTDLKAEAYVGGCSRPRWGSL